MWRTTIASCRSLRFLGHGRRARTALALHAFPMSPTVFREKGCRFFFFSREELRPHVDVVSGDGEARFWLDPAIELARNHRYSGPRLREIESIIEAHHDELIAAWRRHFPG